VRIFYRKLLTNCVLVAMSSISRSVTTDLVENILHMQAVRVPIWLSFSMTLDIKVAQGFMFLFFL
jgi:hypothetical protein